MPAELTPEDQLIADLVEAWSTAAPSAGFPAVDFRTTASRPLPCCIVGHEGAARETAKGMDGTARVALRLAVESDLDVTTPAAHRAAVAAYDAAVRALGYSTLALTRVHAILRETPTSSISDRREMTLLAYTAVVTQCEETA